jgi:hypothetical protein
MRMFDWMLHQFRSLGPYLAIELILPGGSIVALLLWTYRRRVAARQPVPTMHEGTLPARLEVTPQRRYSPHAASVRKVACSGR